MIVQCDKCNLYFEDCLRSTLCPHRAFPANDGNNNFAVHEDAYLDPLSPDDAQRIDEIAKKILKRK